MAHMETPRGRLMVPRSADIRIMGSRSMAPFTVQGGVESHGEEVGAGPLAAGEGSVDGGKEDLLHGDIDGAGGDWTSNPHSSLLL